MRILIVNIIRFVPIILLQVLLLNNINFSGYLNPMLYVLILLNLPLEASRTVNMLAGLITGFIIDVFTRTPGLHMGACVFLGFLRPWVLKLLAPRDGYETGVKANIAGMGIRPYLLYSAILVSIHHLYLFFGEAFTLQGWIHTCIKSILSIFFTLFLIFVVQLFSFKRNTGRL